MGLAEATAAVKAEEAETGEKAEAAVAAARRNTFRNVRRSAFGI